MKKGILLTILTFFAFAAMTSCNSDNESGMRAGDEGEQPSKVAQFNDDQVIKGKLRVKLDPAAEAKLMITRSSDGLVATGIAPIDQLTYKINAVKMERVFKVYEEFEERTRAAGLHLWYEVTFDETLPVTRAASQFGDIDEITYVEPVNPVVRIGGGEIVPSLEPATRAPFATMPFDDPRLGDQWHYENDGTKGSYFKEGADINAFDAWKEETGIKDVIVAVIDGGVDGTHEDLVDNMWNDGSGNYGYNFYKDIQAVDPDKHGTHVAGTVAARNNNGKGVCGVAGGDGTPGSGARIMSCQIALGDAFSDDTRIIRAFQYATNNGAVIAQNSWGYSGTTQPMSVNLREAIDYFIKNAGTNGSGVQTGPMKGGVVIFAAGNENTSQIRYPGAYGKVICVAAMNPDFTRAAYSNYGTYINLTAPGGGDTSAGWPTNTQVLSTIPGNAYGWMSGTSMAAPHVSGIAALVVSKYAGPGLEAETVKDVLLRATHSLDELDPKHAGKMGNGYIDAALALRVIDQKKPGKAENVNVRWQSTSAMVSCTVPADEDNGKPQKIEVFYSKRAMDDVSFDKLPTNVRKVEIPVGDYNVGDKVSVILNELSVDTQYFIALSAYDVDKNRSEMVFLDGKTMSFDGVPYDVVVNDYESRTYHTSVMVAKKWSYTITDKGSDAVTLEKIGESKLDIAIDGSKAAPGTYTLKFDVTFEDKKTDKYEVDYTIKDGGTADVHEFNAVGDTHTVILADFLPGIGTFGTVAFSATLSDSDAVSARIENDSELVLTAKAIGECVVTINSKISGRLDAVATITTKLGKGGSKPEPEPDTNSNVNIDLDGDSLDIRVDKADPSEAPYETSAKVDVYNSIGSRVISKTISVKNDGVAVSVDAGKLSIGYYTVIVKINGKETKQTILKR